MRETKEIRRKKNKTALLLLVGMFSVGSAAYAAPELSLSLPTDSVGTELTLTDSLSLSPVQPDSPVTEAKAAYTESVDTLQTSLEGDTLAEVFVVDSLQAIADMDTLQEFPDTLSICDLPEGWRSQLPEGNLYGIPVIDTIRVAFRQGRSTLEEGFEANRMALARLRSLGSLPLMQKIHIVGSASPEGSVAWNWQLSKQRAEVLSDFLKQEAGLPDSVVEYGYIGRDWNRLLQLVETDSMMPYQEEETAFLQGVVDSTAEGEDPTGDNLGQLSRMEEGVPYQYMYANLFPELRRQQCVVRYEIPYVYRCDTVYIPTPVCVYDTLCVHDTLYIEPCRSYYLSVRTNMLLDAGLAPTLGVELYMGKRWSVAAEWSYAWWKSDRRSWYWRTYGGDLALRKWLGKKAKEKPLQGHHLGAYGQMLTYDYETGGRGYLGDKWSWAAGLEYGYSLPIRRRLNIDFSIGVGYMGGEYKEYLPRDGEYVWQVTKERRYFGPTKAEVSLVWLLGCKNTNDGKKGRKR